MLLLLWTGSLQRLSGRMRHHKGGLVLVLDRNYCHRHACLLAIRKLSVFLRVFRVSLQDLIHLAEILQPDKFRLVIELFLVVDLVEVFQDIEYLTCGDFNELSSG